jgi:uncharacterized membrane protein
VQPESAGGHRFERLDALRGVAIVWMAAFHFAYDLNYYGFIDQDFLNDPRWTLQRTCIVSLFLFCVGLGQAVAIDLAPGWPRFWRRWAQVAGCAVLVSAGSWWMFPRSYISFGVLHGIAVMLVLLRLAAPARAWLWPLGAAALLLPWLIQHPVFDNRATNWVGLVTHKPFTEDYVPLLPWIGVALWGMAAGRWLLGGGIASPRHAWLCAALPQWLHAVARPLATLGRWSLTFYMLHQPLLIGAVGLAAAWWQPPT